MSVDVSDQVVTSGVLNDFFLIHQAKYECALSENAILFSVRLLPVLRLLVVKILGVAVNDEGSVLDFPRIPSVQLVPATAFALPFGTKYGGGGSTESKKPSLVCLLANEVPLFSH